MYEAFLRQIAKLRRVAQSTVSRLGRNGGRPLVTQTVCAATTLGKEPSESAPAEARKARLSRQDMKTPDRPFQPGSLVSP
jgi:hypothetical protein